MKLQQPVNPNYAATVVKLPVLRALENSDNLAGASLFGFQAVVPKSYTEDTLGIVFPAETQLSDRFVKENNLYRESTLNKDPKAKGYLEPNRRVRAIKLRGHRSDCLFLPLSALAFTKAKLNELKEGDVFDTLNGVEICRKYELVVNTPVQLTKNKLKTSRVDEKLFPRHFDSDNYWRNQHVIPADAHIYVTQKLHGTSVRVGHTLVNRKLSWLERLARRFGAKVMETEFDYVYGSRRVVKGSEKEHTHYYEKDLWSEAGSRLKGLLPENFIVYGELIGWVDDSPIQSNYTYDLSKGSYELYVYRVTFVNAQGLAVDLSWPQVKEFCKDRALKHVPELWDGRKIDFVVDDFVDKRFCEFRDDVVPLSDPKTVDEGVCVRLDGWVPYILKAKSPMFLQHETKLLDKNVVDMESAS